MPRAAWSAHKDVRELLHRAGQAGQMGMDREFMRTVLQAIHEESIRQQMEVLGK